MTTDSKAVCGGGEAVSRETSTAGVEAAMTSCEADGHKCSCRRFGWQFNADAHQCSARLSAAFAALASTAGARAGDWQPIWKAKRDGTLYRLRDNIGRLKGAPWEADGWYENGPADRCWYTTDDERCEPTEFRELTPDEQTVALGPSPAVPASPRLEPGKWGLKEWRDKAVRLCAEGLNFGVMYDELPDFIAAIDASLSAVPASPRSGAGEGEDEAEESYKLGKRDGYEEGVQDAALRVGHHGEYFYSTLPGEGCPDPEAMLDQIQEIADGLRAGRDSVPPAPAEHGVEIREKIDRGLAGEIMDAAWPEHGGNHRDADFWETFNEAVTFTLKHLSQGGGAGRSEKGEGDGERVKDLAKRARLQALSERTLYGNDAGELYEALADALVDLHCCGALTPAPAQSPSTSDREG